jgi:pSer/pThr/pTyr-binding forkhead associated (FHA) protein
MARIVLRGLSHHFSDRTWESPSLLRVGRLEQLDVVLDQGSVSRYHAEIRLRDRVWRVRDLGSTNGTRLNGVRLGAGQWPLSQGHLVQFGEVSLRVEEVSSEQEASSEEASSEQDVPEAQWAPDDIRAKLVAIPATGTRARKAGLLACAMSEYCGGRAGLDVAERHADDIAGVEELLAARAIAQAEDFPRMRFLRVALSEPIATWPNLLAALAGPLHNYVEIGSGQTMYGLDMEEIRYVLNHPAGLQMTLDLFGPHLGRGTLTPPPASVLSWQGGIVVSIAESIYEERNHTHMPVLADALEDAGCTDTWILDHCRQPGKHWRGCWVVDLLTGRE